MADTISGWAKNQKAKGNKRTGKDPKAKGNVCPYKIVMEGWKAK